MEKAFKYRLYQSSIYNLATSLSQGSGLGTSVSLVDMVKSLAVKKGNVYEVDCELLDLLFDNNHFSRSILNGLQNVVKLFDESVELE
ncbi:MAG TPA: histidine kinase, partial [Leptospiraceae bacterium]|nr:histidine kinase [Leptospiraceae bacterium]